MNTEEYPYDVVITYPLVDYFDKVDKEITIALNSTCDSGAGPNGRELFFSVKTKSEANKMVEKAEQILSKKFKKNSFECYVLSLGMNTKEEIFYLKTELNKLTSRISELQDNCEHPKDDVNTTCGANTGNYDPSCDVYYIDYHCLTCDKKWRDYQ